MGIFSKLSNWVNGDDDEDLDEEYDNYVYDEEDEDDEETYSEGGLWFEGMELVDYDGCFELPEEVAAAIKELGYKVVDLED